MAERHCPCCGKMSKTFRSNNTLEWEKYCLQCYKDYTREERKAREFKQVLAIISGMKVEDEVKDLNLEG